MRKVGEKLLAAAPYLMRLLMILGTAAMFVVGGSIIGHGIPALHHFSEHQAESLHTLPFIGSFSAIVLPMLIYAIVGLTIGAICVALFEIGNKILPKKH